MKTPKIALRLARRDDIPTLQYRDSQEHVIDCDPGEARDCEKEINRNVAWQQIYMAELNGEPPGVLQGIDFS